MLLRIIGLSILAGILYRMGGTNKGTLWRDIGCSLTLLLTCLSLGLTGAVLATLGAYFVTFGLSWGALASYWKLDEKKWGFWAHGAGLSLAVLPIVFITGHWLGFGIRCLVLTLGITLISEFMTWDVGEEFGRGFLIIITMPLLAI
ncbi:MAG: hypothetical protein PHY56_07865 [Candidatus Omnitrophica bacterium]|nr:hypothetical protein [Candidatus Omnitrophota bacterium]